MHRATRFALATVGALLLTVAAGGAAFAHGDHEQGDLSIVVGFAVEPAYAGQPNAVELTITHDGEPVVDLAAGDLTVDVSLGDAATTLEAEPAFEVGEWGTPGVYTASFIPTEPGAYTFHVTGSVDGEDVDFEMSAGPETFSEVVDPAEAEFPPNDGPSSDDLAAAVDAARTRADDASTVASEANDAVATARTFGMVGLVVGAAGLVVAIVALVAARKRGERT
jgi:hypothetical protein